MRLQITWMENNEVLVFEYEQEDYQIFNFKVYSSGLPGTSLSDYTFLKPLKLKTWSEVMEIVPIETLRNIYLVEEEEQKA